MRTCKPTRDLTTRLLIPSLATLLLATGALAQEPPADAPKTPTEAFMKELDKNGDAQVSLDEVKAPQQARFKETDANGDGVITKEEAREAFAKQVPPEMMEEMKKRGMPDPGDTFIQNLDSNQDGQVSEDEFIKPALDSFARMDSNSDGVATADEATVFFDEMQKAMQQRMEEMKKQHGEMMAPPAQQ
ncbi:EF hand [Thiorhodovibrio winogradskyi]|uniref:EF hand n=1 Tax=Thiorhodovibrio winogradskyi TaxID=77007 RepID=A0ABZ0SA31_9GAMM|nr:EF-hand domain-containing protein [Thiorhodovibrio winogradskyi]